MDGQERGGGAAADARVPHALAHGLGLALDAVSVPLMVVDASARIAFLNAALAELLAEHADELPDPPAGLLGAGWEGADVGALLAGSSAPQTPGGSTAPGCVSLSLGGVEFTARINPLPAADGEPPWTLIEWQTAEELASDQSAAVHALRASSSETARIVGLIDEIGFQTELLAVNATMEAARAGDEAQGLALLASDISRLARHSADAAEEVKALIADSVADAESSALVSARSARTVNELSTALDRATAIVSRLTKMPWEDAWAIGPDRGAPLQGSEPGLFREVSRAVAALGEEALVLRALVSAFDPEQSEADGGAGGPGGVERRGRRRPWSLADGAAEGDTGAPSRRLAVGGAGGGDEE